MKKLAVLLLSVIMVLIISGCGNEPKYIAASTKFIEKSASFALDQLTFQIEGQEQRNEVKPESPIGYYNYYKPYEGYYYHVVYGTVTNKSSEQFYTKSLAVEAVGENETYESKFVLINPVSSDFWEDMAPNEELGYFLFSIVPEGKPAPTEYKIYYNDEFKEGEENTFDFCTRLLLS